MKQTGIEELIEKYERYLRNNKSAILMYKNVSKTNDNAETLELKNTEFLADLKELQAEHEEELKQAVVEAYMDASEMHRGLDREAEQYYKANHTPKG